MDCPLTRRELQILRLIARDGLQAAAVAHRLGIAGTTVRNHTERIRAKLHARTLLQAVTVAYNAGWLDPAEAGDPTRYQDRTITPRQQVYLWAFDQHLAARENPSDLERAKTLTDAAAQGLGATPLSTPDRDWIDRLLTTMARLPSSHATTKKTA